MTSSVHADSSRSAGAARSLARLRARVEALPELLASHAAALAAAAARAPAVVAGDPVVVTGIGLSEGPARLTVHALRGRGVRARFAPISSLLTAPKPSPETSPQTSPETSPATFVVFSQGLCPNALAALRHAARYRRALLVTAAGQAADAGAGPGASALDWFARDARGTILQHPPAREDGMLLRVLGPALAGYVGLAWALVDDRGRTTHAARALAEVPSRLSAQAPDLPPAWSDALARPDVALALISAGDRAGLHHGLAWTLQEGLWRPSPPIWDALSFAHGPLQSIYERPALLLAPTFSEDPVGAALLERLERTLDPRRHALARLPATLPAPYGWFEHALAADRLLLAALARRGDRDLAEWPGKGVDAPLYELDGAP
ncbi:MAG: hypothetical protein H6713_38170 [Myxococcales bacterium]|nr:hypothetical protein [Myxococcales bacterium]